MVTAMGVGRDTGRNSRHDRRTPIGLLSGGIVFLFLEQVPNSPVRPDSSPSRRFLDTAPQRDIVFDRVDIVPFDETIYGGIVQFGIEDRTAPILDGIFDGGDDDDNDQGDSIECGFIDTEDREELDKGYC